MAPEILQNINCSLNGNLLELYNRNPIEKIKQEFTLMLKKEDNADNLLIVFNSSDPNFPIQNISIQLQVLTNLSDKEGLTDRNFNTLTSAKSHETLKIKEEIDTMDDETRVEEYFFSENENDVLHEEYEELDSKTDIKLFHLIDSYGENRDPDDEEELIGFSEDETHKVRVAGMKFVHDLYLLFLRDKEESEIKKSLLLSTDTERESEVSEPHIVMANRDDSTIQNKEQSPYLVRSGRRKICYQCSQQFEDNDFLKIHIQDVHKSKKYDPKNRPFPCNECDFRSVSMGYLRVHKRRKHGELNFKCSHCVFKTSVQDVLKYHLKRQHRTTC